MAQVTIRINGYAYIVGCEDGQESHLEHMAAEIEQRINSIKAIGGQSGEARLLMLAALLLADELHDTRTNTAANPPARTRRRTGRPGTARQAAPDRRARGRDCSGPHRRLSRIWSCPVRQANHPQGRKHLPRELALSGPWSGYPAPTCTSRPWEDV